MVLAESSNLRLTEEAGLVGARFARFARVCRVCTAASAAVPFGLSRFSFPRSLHTPSSCTFLHSPVRFFPILSRRRLHLTQSLIQLTLPGLDPSPFFQASFFVQVLPSLLITFVTFLKLPFPSCTTCRVYRAGWIHEAFVCRPRLSGTSGLQLRASPCTQRSVNYRRPLPHPTSTARREKWGRSSNKVLPLHQGGTTNIPGDIPGARGNPHSRSQLSSSHSSLPQHL